MFSHFWTNENTKYYSPVAVSDVLYELGLLAAARGG